MRAINIPDLVGSQPCTHKHMHEHACVPQAPPIEDGKRVKEVGRREKPMNYEKKKKKKSSSAAKDPLASSPTYSFHPLAIILQTLPVCLPASTL